MSLKRRCTTANYSVSFGARRQPRLRPCLSTRRTIKCCNQASEVSLSVANIAAAHGMSEVLDQLVATLCKFSNESLAKDAISPSGERLRPLVVFGEDIKACAATRTIFGIAHKYGDTLRQGWCNILDTVLRMTKVGLVPEDIFVSGSDFAHRSEMQTMRVREIAAAKRNQGSSLLRSFSAMISGDDGARLAVTTAVRGGAEDRGTCHGVCDSVSREGTFRRHKVLGARVVDASDASTNLGRGGSRTRRRHRR